METQLLVSEETQRTVRSVLAERSTGNVYRIMEEFDKALDCTNPLSKHCMRVALASGEIAYRHGITVSERESLIRGALLHDVGMFDASLIHYIVTPPEQLNRFEIEEIARTHAAKGYEVTQGLRDQRARQIIVEHHDREPTEPLVPYVQIADRFDRAIHPRVPQTREEITRSIEHIIRETASDPVLGPLASSALSIFAPVLESAPYAVIR